MTHTYFGHDITFELMAPVYDAMRSTTHKALKGHITDIKKEDPPFETPEYVTEFLESI